jgi:filamentous hemagglutinin
VSGGALHVTDSERQRQLTGQTADEAVAGLSRDTTGTQATIAPIFDKEKIEAGFDIASQFVNQAGTFVSNRAKEADAAKAAANDRGRVETPIFVTDSKLAGPLDRV